MKVTISEVNDIHEAVLASGLSLWIEGIGVTVEAPPMPLNLTMQPVAPPAAAEALADRTVRVKTRHAKTVPPPVAAKPKRKYTKRAESAKAEDFEAPRITIRQRVLNIVKDKPRTCPEIHAELVKQGVSETVDTSQHCYLAKRDGLIKQDEDGRYRAA
jgi:hypothetical protein